MVVAHICYWIEGEKERDPDRKTRYKSLYEKNTYTKKTNLKKITKDARHLPVKNISCEYHIKKQCQKEATNHQTKLEDVQ
jgi:hypothetical protein